MKTFWLLCVVVLAVTVAAIPCLAGTVPEQINYQAKVEAGGVPFDGVGKFKFAIVDQGGTNTYWSNDGSSTGGSEPTNAVSLNVSSGLLNVMLGDASHENMQTLPASVFQNPDTWLRVWFGGSAGTTFERLSPDSKLASAPYAMMAETVPDKSITGKKLAKESVWPQHEGRGDCIVSYYVEYSGASLSNLCTIATNKNFIITDVVFGGIPIPWGHINWAHLEIRYTKDSTNTVLFKQFYFANGDTGGPAKPWAVSFRGGLVVPAGATLKAGGYSVDLSNPQSCTITGFEIPVE